MLSLNDGLQDLDWYKCFGAAVIAQTEIWELAESAMLISDDDNFLDWTISPRLKSLVRMFGR